MLVVPKDNGDVHVCVDLTHLNQSMKWVRHVLPSVEQLLAQIVGATIFSRLDANSGCGRLSLTVLLFFLPLLLPDLAIFALTAFCLVSSSAPEHFQKRMCIMFNSIEWVICIINSILIYGKLTKQSMTNPWAATIERLKRVMSHWMRQVCICQDQGAVPGPHHTCYRD